MRGPGPGKPLGPYELSPPSPKSEMLRGKRVPGCGRGWGIDFMKLKNYTSNVPTSRTISRIEECLTEAGATGIMKDYRDGFLIALSFRVSLPTGKTMAIRLPANSDGVFNAMMKTVRRPRANTAGKVREQSGRTAWKLMQDWVEVQLSLIQMEQADFVQVFLPYVWDGKVTFYEQLKAKNFLALPEAKEA